MEEFNTALVREKIIFMDDMSYEDGDAAKEPIVIRSNRIFLRLGKSPVTEKIVIRAQNMHTTLRIAAKILHSYHHDGLLLDRSAPFNWEESWESIIAGYEKEYNPDIWTAIYINGRPVFKTTSSPFVDVIEKCALLTIDNYDAAMGVTESAMKQIGRAVRINHSSNVATTFIDTGQFIRCGIIHRSSNRDTTFSFTAAGKDQNNRIVQSIGITAAYLELFNLRFTIRSLQEKLRKGQIKKGSPENSRIRLSIARQSAIHKAISSFEEIYEVKYRPEKPDLFSDM